MSIYLSIYIYRVNPTVYDLEDRMYASKTVRTLAHIAAPAQRDVLDPSSSFFGVRFGASYDIVYCTLVRRYVSSLTQTYLLSVMISARRVSSLNTF